MRARPVRPAPLADSLQLLRLNRIFPDPYPIGRFRMRPSFRRQRGRQGAVGSTLADVFFVRIHETEYAILPRAGRWIGIGVGTCDQVNTGC